MRITHDELVSTARQAFQGLGFRHGDCQDAADMVAWLELHGMGGLSELGKGLRYLAGEARESPDLLYGDDRMAVLDAHGASVLAVGALAVDRACAMARRTRLATLRVENCHNRLLIVGHLTRIAREGVNLLAYWENRGAEPVVYTVSITAGDELPTVRAYDASEPSGGSTRDLTLIASPDFVLAPLCCTDALTDRPRLSPAPEFMRSHMERCFGEGIEVDERVWSELTELAGRDAP